ncbi:MAG: serine/threonine protein kinase [Deltaproteobacteria bacterium]|nr:MAG: serine/threonine protein kinase [Deltaproteobacteria bacterium]
MALEVFGNYVVERHLGRGGMADVHLARVRTGARAGTAVALKRLRPEVANHPEYADLFVGEADLSRYLKHPNIIEVIEAGSVDEVTYIAMELMDGWDLHTLLRAAQQRRIAVPWRLGCHIAQMVGQGLHFAHTAKTATGTPMGIVHCDVTPANIFITRDGRVKIGDFGVAFTGATGRALEVGLAGQPHYFAPEQILAEPATPATDVFALGVVLYEMLTWKRPFEGAGARAICRRILRGRTSPPSRHRHDVPHELDALVLSCLRRRAATRPGPWARLCSRIWGPPLRRLPTAQSLVDALRTFAAPAPLGPDNLQHYLQRVNIDAPAPVA